MTYTICPLTKYERKRHNRKNGPVIVKRNGVNVVIPQCLINNNGSLKRKAVRLLEGAC